MNVLVHLLGAEEFVLTSVEFLSAQQRLSSLARYSHLSQSLLKHIHTNQEQFEDK